MHWTDQFSSSGRVDALVEGHTDPVSGQPVRVRPGCVGAISRVLARFRGVGAVAAKGGPSITGRSRRTNGGFRLELAGLSPVDDWTAFAHDLLSLTEGTDLLAYHDAGTGQYRFAAFDGDRMTGAVFSPAIAFPFRAVGPASRFVQTVSEPRDRLRMLAGRAARGGEDRGAIVCSCFEVGVKQITNAVLAGRCGTVEQIGKELRAGTNCGSCRTEIRKSSRVTAKRWPHDPFEAAVERSRSPVW